MSLFVQLRPRVCALQKLLPLRRSALLQANFQKVLTCMVKPGCPAPGSVTLDTVSHELLVLMIFRG